MDPQFCDAVATIGESGYIGAAGRRSNSGVPGR